MKKRTIAIALILLLLLIGGTVWAMRSRKDPKVAEIKAKMQQARTQGQQPSEKQRQEFFKEIEHLTPDQRRQVFEGMRGNMERRMNQRIAAYFALPPNQRTAFLDKQIQEDEKRRKEMEALLSSCGFTRVDFLSSEQVRSRYYNHRPADLPVPERTGLVEAGK